MKDADSSSSGKGARVSLNVKPGSTTGSAEFHDLPIVPSCLRLKRILVPVDFSESADKALHYATRFAEQFGAEITLLHVIQPMVYPADFGYPPTIVDTLDDTLRKEIEERLGALASRSAVKLNPLVRVGQPYNEIVMAAKELDVDLIIIATHGRTGFKHVLLGSTAERVVRHAPCPVLTVRNLERDFA